MGQDGLTVICAWCDAVVQPGGPEISHGICTNCAVSFLSRLPVEYLRSIAEPDGTVTLFSGVQFVVPTVSGESR